jgi:hypothetical protein
VLRREREGEVGKYYNTKRMHVQLKASYVKFPESLFFYREGNYAKKSFSK